MIRNILYLDESKMYSFSSQIFEGVLEYVIKEIGSSKEEAEEQKGPIGSGKVLADAMKLSERSIEKRYLHDHSLALFESKLHELGLIVDVDSEAEPDFSEIESKSFVRVQARCNFIDAAKMNALLSSFNKLGEALAHVTSHTQLMALKEAVANGDMGPAEGPFAAQLRKLEKELTNTSELAKKRGMHQDPKFLQNLALVTQFGLSGQLEIQQNIGSQLFSACLKRDYLREAEDMMIRKYSRRTEKMVVVLGTVTQSSRSNDTSTHDEIEITNMKSAVSNIVNRMADLEDALVGKAKSEIVIDPIAVYVLL